jgi:hypothetical protein
VLVSAPLSRAHDAAPTCDRQPPGLARLPPARRPVRRRIVALGGALPGEALLAPALWRALWAVEAPFGNLLDVRGRVRLEEREQALARARAEAPPEAPEPITWDTPWRVYPDLPLLRWVLVGWVRAGTPVLFRAICRAWWLCAELLRLRYSGVIGAARLRAGGQAWAHLLDTYTPISSLAPAPSLACDLTPWDPRSPVPLLDPARLVAVQPLPAEPRRHPVGAALARAWHTFRPLLLPRPGSLGAAAVAVVGAVVGALVAFRRNKPWAPKDSGAGDRDVGRVLRAPLLMRVLRGPALLSPWYAGPEDVESAGRGGRVLDRTRWFLGAEGLHPFDRPEPALAWAGHTTAARYVEASWRDASLGLRLATLRRTRALLTLLGLLGFERRITNRVYLYKVDALNHQLFFYNTWGGLIGAEQALKVWGV